MDERSEGGPEIAEAERPDAQAEVDVVERDRKRLVESLRLEEGVAPDDQARRRDGGHVVRQLGAAEVARVIAGKVLVLVSRGAADPEQDATMLQGPVGI